MNIKTKAGVVFKEFNNEFIKLIKALGDVGELFGKPLTITSANDGKHMDTSLHYSNLAWDIRIKDLAKEMIPRLVSELKVRLPSYTVILETDHVHIEFDNRR